jgi:hypothetical protein
MADATDLKSVFPYTEVGVRVPPRAPFNLKFFKNPYFLSYSKFAIVMTLSNNNPTTKILRLVVFRDFS